MMDIYIENNTDEDITKLEPIVIAAVEQTLKSEGIEFPLEASIVFVGNDEIAKLSGDYRGKFAPTDVLSFPQMEKEEIAAANRRGAQHPPAHMLGDIIISLDKAKEQAAEYGHSIEREVGFLTVHSVLHLLGHDHETEEELDRMNEKQESILKEIGLTR